MLYFELSTRLYPEQALVLRGLATDRGTVYTDHTSEGDDTKLGICRLSDRDAEMDAQVRSIFHADPTEVTLMRIKAGQEVVPHVDGEQYRRMTSVVFPLIPAGTEKYAPCTMYMDAGTFDLPWVPCYAFNTQVKHGVKNNEYDRYNLQLWFDMPIEEFFELYQSGQLISPENSVILP
jgi:hypothetical protein